jgi:hypothetical protein
MKKIELLVTEASKIKNELGRLDDMEANARAKIISATDEDVTTPAAQQAIANARLTLEVVAARRAKLKSPFSGVRETLQEQFKAEGKRWNAAVEVARLAKEMELVAALLPFWEGDEKLMRRIMGDSLLSPTIFHQYRQAFFQFPYYPRPEEQDLVRDVRIMIAHIGRWSRDLGLS